jgi:uncharacterized protein YecE (DUF72 family)
MTKIHVGTMGWSYSFWVNNFYPESTKPEAFLEEYSKYFNTVEVNSSFYRVPSVSILENWKKQTPESFLFSVKVPKKVTHGSFAKESYDYLDYFIGNISTLGSKLGPLLLQFPPSFKFDRFNSLKNLVSILPKSYRCAVELRNNSWFEDRFLEFLKEHRIALVVSDSPWLDKMEKVTSSFVYFRLEGNRKQINGTKGIVEKDRTVEVQNLASKIQSFSDEIEVFCYFSKYFSGHPPTDARKLLRILKS